MARRPSTAENLSLRNSFPLLDTTNVWVLGEPTWNYNCLAWALGITGRWVWPWGSRNATDSEMTAFLRTNGYIASSSGTRLTWGFSWSSIGHISRYYSSTWGWTSKLGAWLLMNHPRDGLNYGSYGSKRRFYTRAGILSEWAAGPEFPAQDEIDVSPSMELIELSDNARKRADELAAAVPADVRKAFEAAYRSWLEAVRSNPVIDSSTSFLTHPPEFVRLLGLGPQIVPLVMQRLADPNEWVALALADALLPHELGIEVSLDDPRALEGEQGRARRLLELWVEAS